MRMEIHHTKAYGIQEKQLPEEGLGERVISAEEQVWDMGDTKRKRVEDAQGETSGAKRLGEMGRRATWAWFVPKYHYAMCPIHHMMIFLIIIKEGCL